MTKTNATYGVSVKKRVIFAPAYATRQSTVAAEDVQNFKPFSSVKDLLATGFLEGAPVKYVFKKHQVELHGFIVRDGYQCGCSSCNYTRVLSANEFEKHSGVTSSFANDHILLENGISLNEVVKHLVNTPLDSLQETLEELTGCEIDSEDYEAWRKGLFLVRSPTHDRKQIKATRELNQESPSDLISQLKLELRLEFFPRNLILTELLAAILIALVIKRRYLDQKQAGNVNGNIIEEN